MFKLARITVFLSVILVLSSVNFCFGATSTNFVLYTDALGIQIHYTRTQQTEWIFLEALTNMINSSANTLHLTRTGTGYLSFYSNETFNLQIDFSDMKVTLEGDQGNTKRLIQNETSYAVTAGNTVVIGWNVVVEPWVPYLFILGMLGLGSMFGGSLYSIHLFKKKEYRWALVQGVTFIAVGFGLFISWVFA